MAMPAIDSREWTVSDIQAIPGGGNRYECIDGALFVSPSPTRRHQQAVLELGVALRNDARAQHIGWVWIAPSDLVLGRRTVVQPDLRVHTAGPGASAAAIAERSLLIVEILSRSTARLDRHEERHLYVNGAAEQYWIVDLASELIEVWSAGSNTPSIATEALAWQPPGATERFELELPAFFADANAWAQEHTPR